MKLHDEFDQIQREHVNLDKTRRVELGQRMNALAEYLSNNHAGFIRTERQGSHALRTIIRPTTKDSTVDVDLLVMVDYESDDCSDYVPALKSTLKNSDRYKDNIEVKNRCVTVKFSEQSRCEVDLVPCVGRNEKFYICPIDGDDFEETDGTGYREWFNEKNAITNGNLKRAVRILKFARDHHRQFDCSSIVLTTLAGLSVSDHDEGSDEVSTQADMLVTVLERMASSLDKMSYPPAITNPALEAEDFDPHWSKSEFNRFRHVIRQLATDARDALEESHKKESIKKWQKVCGEQFKEHNGGGSSGSSLSSSLSSSTRKRSAGFGGAVRPPRPYAGDEAATISNDFGRFFPVSMSEMDALNAAQPLLELNYGSQSIAGRLHVVAEYDQRDGLLHYVQELGGQSRKELICDSFDIQILLSYSPTILNPWPPVFETRGRSKDIMLKHGISNLSDLHLYPGERNMCCLGLEGLDTEYEADISTFVRDLVVPFFYRLAYVDRYGLQAARGKLWGEYSHGRLGYREYIGEMQNRKRRIGRKRLCFCGSGRKFKRCHLDRINNFLGEL